MPSYLSVPTNSRGEAGSVSPSDLTPSSESFEDEVFSVMTFKKHRDRQQRFLSSDTSAVDGESLEAQDEDGVKVDAVANGNSVTRHGRNIYVERNIRRFVFKNGACNVSARNVLKRNRRYLEDIFTTLIDMKWRYNLVMFGVAFMGSWCVFAVCWWSIAVAHGDHLSPNSTTGEPCVTGVYDFLTAFLFSVETQHTIGYGSRVIEPHCPHGILLLMVQACCGIFIQSLMTGLVFSKLSRPKHRADTLMFSHNAVICLRDGGYCLLFRLGDMRSTHLVDTSIRALIVMDRSTDEGETIPLCQSSFTIETETNFDDSFVFLVWPITFVHRIVPGSPLYALSAEKLRLTDFEIVVILEGVVESTGYCIQIRTSYLPSEVLWGHRQAPLVTYEKCNGRYEIDFKQFDNVIPITSMPDCSAKEYDDKSAERNDASKDDYPFSFTAKSGCRPSHTSLRRLISRRWRSKVISGGECIAGKMSPPVAATLTRKFGRQLSVEVCSKARHPAILRSKSHQ